MKKLLVLATSFVLIFSACKLGKREEGKIGTDKVPLKIGFMPAPDKSIMPENVKIFADKISKMGGIIAEPVIEKNYMSLIDALANKKIDVAFINSLGFLLAHDWCNAEAIFQLKGEDGKMVYKSAIITRADSGIKSLADLNGKTLAYSDPFSMAGYLLPLSVFNENKIVPKDTIFAGGYSDVVELVYIGKVQAGAIYFADHDPDGRIHDARVKLVGKYNDLIDKVPVIYVSDSIPTTPIVFRKELDPAVKEKAIKAFEAISNDQEAISALNKLYGTTGIVPADSKSYEYIRGILKKLGKEVQEVVPGAVAFYKKHFWDTVPSY